MSAEVTVQQTSTDGVEAHAADEDQPPERIGIIFVHGIGEQKFQRTASPVNFRPESVNRESAGDIEFIEKIFLD